MEILILSSENKSDLFEKLYNYCEEYVNFLIKINKINKIKGFNIRN